MTSYDDIASQADELARKRAAKNEPMPPMPMARTLKATFRGLVHWQGEFHSWDAGAYRTMTDDAVRAATYAHLEASGERPRRTRVADVVDALRAVAHLSADTEPGTWLTSPGRDTRNLVAVRNGILDLTTGELHRPDPDYFAVSALPVAYDADAGEPVAWRRFLRELWEDDDESMDALQEWFGYLLTDWTALQKILLVVGPKRAGKGTIFRVLTALLGRDNVSAPTLGSLSQQFGLQALIGRLAALVSDARLGGRADQTMIAERLLSISGEDHVAIPRKFLPDHTARLGCRFVLATNELPRVHDSSGALASRFVILVLTRTFYGKEDAGLTDRLTAELPAILTWAIEGRRRLMERGRFTQPASGREAIEMLTDLSSPVGAFVEQCCEVGPGLTVLVDDLYRRWREWCVSNGRAHPGTKHSFGRDLLAVVPTIRKDRKRIEGERTYHYHGITLAAVPLCPGPVPPSVPISESLEATEYGRFQPVPICPWQIEGYAHEKSGGVGVGEKCQTDRDKGGQGDADALIDAAREGTGLTREQARELLSHDLPDLVAGTLPVAAAQHYLEHLQ